MSNLSRPSLKAAESAVCKARCGESRVIKVSSYEREGKGKKERGREGVSVWVCEKESETVREQALVCSFSPSVCFFFSCELLV